MRGALKRGARPAAGKEPGPADLDALLGRIGEVQGRLAITRLVLVTDRAEVVERVARRSSLPIVVATSRKSVQKLASRGPLRTRVEGVLLIQHEVSGGLDVLAQLKEILLSALLEGMIHPKDRALCLASNDDAVDVIVTFDVGRDLALTRLREDIEDRVPLRVVERVLRLAAELVREGREGSTIGALFILGDVDEVMRRSRQVVLNPFRGYAEGDRSILADSTWETAKEFSLLDGAFIVREDGIILAAGRYVEFDKGVDLQSGLGGRHLAAASITSITKAVAVTVSTSGAVRVFKDGRIVLKVNKP